MDHYRLSIEFYLGQNQKDKINGRSQGSFGSLAKKTASRSFVAQMMSLTVYFLFLCLTGCSTHQTEYREKTKKTYILCPAQPAKALSLAENYLEWHRGMDIAVHDFDRGMIVTKWTSQGPLERIRVTLRATNDPGGSILSAHAERQVLEENQWLDIPTEGELESVVLTEINNHIQASRAK